MRNALVAAGWAWAGAIVWLSLTPAPPTVDFSHSDKLGHLLGYGLLMFWFCQLYQGRKTRIAYALGFIAMGMALEYLQSRLGYRTYEIFDIGANSLGVLLGWVVALVLPGIRTS